MAFLASNELDGVEEKHLSQAPRSLSAFPLPQAQTQLLGAIIRLWPLGLVLANAAVGVRGFQRKLVVWACLQLPSSSPSSYPVQTTQEQAGVTSIRALPQVSRDGMDGGPAHNSAGSPTPHCGRQEAKPSPQQEDKSSSNHPCWGNQKPELPTWLQAWISAIITNKNFPEPFLTF